MISLPGWLSQECRMRMYKCGESSVHIYSQRTNKLHEVAANAVKKFKICSKPGCCFYVHHCDEIIADILSSTKENGEPYADLTKKNWLDVAEKLASHLSSDKADIEAMEAIDKYSAEIHRIDAAYRNREKRSGYLVEDILERIHMHYPPDSKESVLIRLYLEVPVRDDFDLAIINEDELADANPNQNYLIPCPSQRRIKILIQKSKNVAWNKKQKPRIYTLSKQLTLDLGHYLLRQSGRTDKVFGPTSKLYKEVGRILKEIGLKTGRDSINLLRGAVASSAKLTGDNDQIADAARKSLHSVATSEVYERVRSVVSADSAVCDNDLNISNNP